MTARFKDGMGSLEAASTAWRIASKPLRSSSDVVTLPCSNCEYANARFLINGKSLGYSSKPLSFQLMASRYSPRLYERRTI